MSWSRFDLTDHFKMMENQKEALNCDDPIPEMAKKQPLYRQTQWVHSPQDSILHPVYQQIRIHSLGFMNFEETKSSRQNDSTSKQRIPSRIMGALEDAHEQKAKWTFEGDDEKSKKNLELLTSQFKRAYPPLAKMRLLCIDCRDLPDPDAGKDGRHTGMCPDNMKQNHEHPT